MFTLTLEQLRLIVRQSKDTELRIKALKELRRRTKVYNQVFKSRAA